MERQTQELRAEGWRAVIAVREDGGLVQALVMPDQTSNVIQGFVVLYQDPEDLVLVNVIGCLQPETCGTLMDELDIEVPGMPWNGKKSPGQRTARGEVAQRGGTRCVGGPSSARRERSNQRAHRRR